MKQDASADLAMRQAGLRRAYAGVRACSMQLIAGLSAEDCMVQSMPDASPVKWHLAHVTWFFETFLLEPAETGFQPFDPAFRVLFNSYYVGVGERHPRPARGVLSRPALDTVLAYRRDVDLRMDALMDSAQPADVLNLIELGLHHEQQHQELMLTDLKHHFWCNPLHPVLDSAPRSAGPVGPLRWLPLAGGVLEVGYGADGFAFDNERPAHAVWLAPFELASRPVTQGEFLAFMADDGYRRPELWLSDGWDACMREGWQAPLYWWRDAQGAWQTYMLHGEQAPEPHVPVMHLSYYEADAYARWAGARLPTEQEWECAARAGLAAGSGEVWEWTASAYLPYPGFRQAAGAVGEYNGKFMINQMVLRGGSMATPSGHVRPTYRNFFNPAARWQFSGLRLARDSARGEQVCSPAPA
ncbi:ergothioneine biosynthesis protein EgtB [Andreprevotia lacus DSM 23236]|uniref:Ergothioneine biosynthesis protein EgtB n=1 Tax=Andreprevotia lacus DSM 23236 TaxID=1121001 RepID=A0A1W1X1X9_9NEIS|nr:ergothioneine biosynthesis protein EgtB [Andreprevotia lacus]SMC17942.1 ergothioneine biosynthesis protein EgtB [Andreprevotia lacus DSM 23236]